MRCVVSFENHIVNEDRLSISKEIANDDDPVAKAKREKKKEKKSIKRKEYKEKRTKFEE